MPICSERAVPRSATEPPWSTQLLDGGGCPLRHPEGHGYPSPEESADQADQLDALRPALIALWAQFDLATMQPELAGEADQLDALQQVLTTVGGRYMFATWQPELAAQTNQLDALRQALGATDVVRAARVSRLRPDTFDSA